MVYKSTEQYCSFPANKLTPRIANIKNIQTTTIPTLKIAPIEESKAITKVFIDELCEMNLSGLKIRSNLRILTIGMLILEKLASMREVTTIKKSICDQLSLKYELLHYMNP